MQLKQNLPSEKFLHIRVVFLILVIFYISPWQLYCVCHLCMFACVWDKQFSMDRETWHDGWWILTGISAKGAKFLMKNSTWSCVAAELS